MGLKETFQKSVHPQKGNQQHQQLAGGDLSAQKMRMTKCLGKRGESWDTPRTRTGHGDSSDNTTTPKVVDPRTFYQKGV